MHGLVKWPLHRQRFQQLEGLVGQSAGHQGTSEVPHQPGSNCAQPVAMQRRPVLIEVLGEELTRPQGERVANVLGHTGRGSDCGRCLEVVDVDGHTAPAAEDDDLVPENEVLGANHPTCRMQRLMEVVRADRRVGLGPQLLDEHITVNPMARPERQELDDRLCLPQPPRWWCGALDAHREPAQETDPHGSARVAHSRMLPARRSLGNRSKLGSARRERVDDEMAVALSTADAVDSSRQRLAPRRHDGRHQDPAAGDVHAATCPWPCQSPRWWPAAVRGRIRVVVATLRQVDLRTGQVARATPSQACR